MLLVELVFYAIVIKTSITWITNNRIFRPGLCANWTGRIDLELSWEDVVSYLGYSGVMEDGEAFMSMNGLWSSCLARGTHVLQIRGYIFMS